MFKIYTDGACSGNPGPGGWAAVLVHNDDHFGVISGHDLDTTNNRMELFAVIEALKFVIEKSNNKEIKERVEIHSDSAYVVNAVKDKWLKKWQVNGWKRADGKEIQNKDLWQILIKLSREINTKNIKLIKVKGHNGDRWNEEADRQARIKRDKAKKCINEEDLS